MTNIVKYKLDHRGKSYLTSQVSVSSPLHLGVRDRLSNTVGDTFSFVPCGASEAEIYSFTQGELLTVNRSARVFRTSPMVRVTNLVSELKDYLKGRLDSSAGGETCFIEHPMLKPGEESAEIKAATMYLGDRIVFSLDQTSEYEDVLSAIEYCFTPWSFLAIVSKVVSNTSFLTLEEDQRLQSVIRNISVIIVAAYKGESFVIYEVTE